MAEPFKERVWCRGLRDTDLPSTWKLVGLTLVLWRNYQSGECYPSRAELADACSLSDRSVDAAIAGLEQAGWLTVHRSKGGNGVTNQYHFETGNSERRSRLTAKEVRPSTSSMAKSTTPNGERPSTNGDSRSPEGFGREREGSARGARTSQRNGTPRTHIGKEPTVTDVMDACRLYLHSPGWDQDYTEDAMRDEFCDREERHTTTGDFDLETLIREWKILREQRYGVSA